MSESLHNLCASALSFAHGAMHHHPGKADAKLTVMWLFLAAAILTTGFVALNWKLLFNNNKSGTGTATAMLALVLGFFLFFVGVYIYFVYEVYSNFVSVLQGVGAGTVVGTLLAGGSHIRNLFANQSLYFNSVTVVSLGAVLIFMVFVNVMGDRRSRKLDFTKDKLETLSDKSVQLIKGLQRTVNVLGFFYKEEKQLEVRVRDFVEKYRSFNQEKIKVRIINPLRDPKLASCYGVKDEGMNKVKNRLVLAIGSCDVDRNGRYAYKGGPKIVVEKLTEQDFTRKLNKITRTKIKQICFLRGHFQPDIDDKGRGGLSGLKTRLKERSYEVRSVDLSDKTEVPSSCDVLVNNAPESSRLRRVPSTIGFTDAEQRMIADYLKKGGKMFATQEPVVNTNLQEVFKTYGIKVGGGVVVDFFLNEKVGDRNLPYAPQAINFDTRHPITKRLFRKVRGRFFWATAVSKMKGMPAGVAATELIRSLRVPVRGQGGGASKLKCCSFHIPNPNDQGFIRLMRLSQSWVRNVVLSNVARGAVTKFVPKAEAGPISLGVAASKKVGNGKETRLVVFGDTAIASNQLFYDNANLVINSIAWLAKDKDQISIPTKRRRPSRVFLTKPQKNMIKYTAYFGMPMFFFFAILFVLVRRLQ